MRGFVRVGTVRDGGQSKLVGGNRLEYTYRRCIFVLEAWLEDGFSNNIGAETRDDFVEIIVIRCRKKGEGRLPRGGLPGSVRSYKNSWSSQLTTGDRNGGWRHRMHLSSTRGLMHLMLLNQQLSL